MAGVLGVLVEVDQGVEQGVEAARPGEVGGLDPAGVGLGGAGGGGEGEQGADAVSEEAAAAAISSHHSKPGSSPASRAVRAAHSSS